jgi:hypothetical protein
MGCDLLGLRRFVLNSSSDCIFDLLIKTQGSILVKDCMVHEKRVGNKFIKLVKNYKLWPQLP